MCSHHLDDFEWFIRADDDVYIRVEKLKKFLSQIDADKMVSLLLLRLCILLNTFEYLTKIVSL